jgi:hypothetical protein
MKTTIVIPTYWGRPDGDPFNPADVVYDHPTPLNQEGTLARALSSFAVLNRADFDLVVIAAPTHPSLETAAVNKIAEIIAPYRNNLNVRLVAPVMVYDLRIAMSNALGIEIGSIIDGYGYSNIRNLCLIAGHASAADLVILIDDDEVIEDPDFLNKAREFMDGSGDKAVKGKAGWYMRPDGGYKGPSTVDAIWMEWLGAEAMNEGFDAVIGQPGRMGPTPFAFGGNMVISREIFTKIAFDPKITRGEDIDYVFNAMMRGFTFMMDRDLWIRHLPPVSQVPAWMGFRQNALRFTYARQKLLTQASGGAARVVELSELQPYPGRFLGPSLDEKIRRTCDLLGQKYMEAGDTAGYRESMLNMELVEQIKQREQNATGDYLEYESRWRKLMEKLPHYKEHLEGL